MNNFGREGRDIAGRIGDSLRSQTECVKKFIRVNSNGVAKSTLLPTLISVGLLLPLFLVLSQRQTGVIGWTGILWSAVDARDKNRGQGSSRGHICPE